MLSMVIVGDKIIADELFWGTIGVGPLVSGNYNTRGCGIFGAALAFVTSAGFTVVLLGVIPSGSLSFSDCHLADDQGEVIGS